MRRKLSTLALAAMFALFASGAMIPAEAANSGKPATAENLKKPGKSCDGLDHDSSAFKNCVAGAAHGSKTPKGAAHGKGKPAG